MLLLNRVTKEYGEQCVVDHVDLTVEQGKKLVLIGRSGSGKTTLLKMINRLISLSEGTIMVDGKEIQSWSAVNLRRHLGYVIQEVGLFPHYTIEQNVGLVPVILGWEKEKISQRVRELLQLVGIAPALYSRKPDSLSGGQQQRVGIARALAADPGIILMDEPFGALDPITRSSLQQEFISLPGIEHKTVIIVTHDMEEAALLGDAICLIDQGRIQQNGTLAELLFRPANSFVSDFLKNQRHQLELKAIRLEDMLSWLPQTKDQASDVEKVSLSSSLREIIVNDQSFLVQHRGITYYGDPDLLRSHFYQHREEIIRNLP